MPGGEHFAAHALGRDGFTSGPAILEFHWCIFKYARLNTGAATPRERWEGPRLRAVTAPAPLGMLRLNMGLRLSLRACLVFALPLLAACNSQSSDHPAGRFQIFYSPRAERNTFLLDTETGRVWRPRFHLFGG